MTDSEGEMTERARVAAKLYPWPYSGERCAQCGCMAHKHQDLVSCHDGCPCPGFAQDSQEHLRAAEERLQEEKRDCERRDMEYTKECEDKKRIKEFFKDPRFSIKIRQDLVNDEIVRGCPPLPGAVVTFDQMIYSMGLHRIMLDSEYWQREMSGLEDTKECNEIL